jgi:hypothetical protein
MLPEGENVEGMYPIPVEVPTVEYSCRPADCSYDGPNGWPQVLPVLEVDGFVIDSEVM